MEDDFLFHTRGSYVNDAIRIMEDKTLIDSGENIKQILYNRNFGETINDYNIQGHRMIRQNGYELAVHVHIGGQTFPYGNCHYWPHYSFRLSIIDVETILSLGNYDSENQFFEMDYALKWMNAGYRSGFYNKITNRHIGEGNYHLDSGRSGSRSMDPDKYTKDAAVLERGYHDEMTKVGGDRGLAERYAFYCAQSYMDAGPLYFDKSVGVS